MKYILIIPFAVSLLLAGCQERENPLAALSSMDVAEWIFNNQTLAINQCAVNWNNQASSPASDLEGCKDTAKDLAELLTKGGFGEIEAANVLLPTIWSKYADLTNFKKRNSYNAQKAGEAMKLPSNGTLGNRIEEFKKQRGSQ